MKTPVSSSLLSASEKTRIALKKTCLDIFAFAPVNNSIFVGVNLYFSGLKADEIVKNMKAEQMNTIYKLWLYWFPVQMINFTFMPLYLQAVYVQIAALFWHSFLSWMTQKRIREQKKYNSAL